jgi:hypothetical protein
LAFYFNGKFLLLEFLPLGLKCTYRFALSFSSLFSPWFKDEKRSEDALSRALSAMV